MLDRYEEYARLRIFQLIAAPFESVAPNTLSSLGFVFAGLTGLCLYLHWFTAAFFGLLTSMFFDGIDGYVARKSGKVSDIGFLYDHVSDRLSDAAIFIGIGAAFHDWLLSLGVLAVVLFSSYVGVLNRIFELQQNKEGLFNRTNRIYSLLLVIALMIALAGHAENIMNSYLLLSLAAGLYTVGVRLYTLFASVARR